VTVTGNDSCAQAHDMTAQATYVSVIEDHDPGEVLPSCGGQGGDVFFAFGLEREQVVYLGALASETDTVLALYRGDCEGELLRCEDEACGMDSGQLVQVLPAGQYVVAVKAKQPGLTAAVRLKFQHADPSGAIVLDRPGVYAGDTRDADDSVQASCPSFGPPRPPVPGDAGVPDAVLRGCPESCPLVGDGGTSIGRGGHDDVYVLSACPGGLIASTCGTADFASVLDVRSGGQQVRPLVCSERSGYCASDPNGGVVDAFVEPGLTFLVVDGRDEAAAGEYQLSVIY
jgi:hypothetical protein